MKNKDYSAHPWGNELQKRFKYNYLDNTLAYQLIDEDLNGVWYQIGEDRQFIRFNSQGFTLDPFNHWINFAVYERQIRVFYKYFPGSLDFNLDGSRNSEKATYYRKYLPKQPEVIFTFGSEDEVEKVAGKWISKK